MEGFAGELTYHAGRKMDTNSHSHTVLVWPFRIMEAKKTIPIPVADLHGYQMIYDGLGVLWETSYVDADNKIKLPLAIMHQQ